MVKTDRMAGLELGVDFAALRKVGPRVAVVGSLAFLIALSVTLITQRHVAG